MPKRYKRLQYLVASFPDDPSANLADCLRAAYMALPTVQDRTLPIGAKTWTGCVFAADDQEFFFQFSATTPGEPATLVQTGNLNVPIVPMGTMPAPQNYDFSDGDIICLVCGNAIYACISQVQYYAIAPFLRELFTKANLPQDVRTVMVEKVANLSRLQEIQRSGVKNIRLNACLDEAEFRSLDDVRERGLLSKMWHAFSGQDESLAASAREAQSRLTVTLTKGKVGRAEWLDAVAADALERDDQYRIETNDGKVLTPDMITIAKTVQVEILGKSVDLDDARRQLEEFKRQCPQELPPTPLRGRDYWK